MMHQLIIVQVLFSDGNSLRLEGRKTRDQQLTFGGKSMWKRFSLILLLIDALGGSTGAVTALSFLSLVFFVRWTPFVCIDVKSKNSSMKLYRVENSRAEWGTPWPVDMANKWEMKDTECGDDGGDDDGDGDAAIYFSVLREIRRER